MMVRLFWDRFRETITANHQPMEKTMATKKAVKKAVAKKAPAKKSVAKKKKK